MTSATKTPHIHQSMGELLSHFPGARRTLFQRYHLGGCSSCSFSMEETLEQLCMRNGNLDPAAVLKELETAHLDDEKLLMDPLDLRNHLYDTTKTDLRILDLRTREEFDAVHIPTSQLLTQELMETTMNQWPKENLLVLIDHQGERGLDAAAYFAGHGFTHVKALRGGIDAYAETADRGLPRYTIEKEEA